MQLKSVVVSAVLITGSTMGGVNAVYADIDNCAGTSTCLWDDNNFQSKLAERTHGSSEIRNLSDADNDKMDSYANNSNVYQTCAWSGRNGTGDRQDWEENENNANVSPLNSDEVSSWRTKFGC